MIPVPSDSRARLQFYAMALLPYGTMSSWQATNANCYPASRLKRVLLGIKDCGGSPSRPETPSHNGNATEPGVILSPMTAPLAFTIGTQSPGPPKQDDAKLPWRRQGSLGLPERLTRHPPLFKCGLLLQRRPDLRPPSVPGCVFPPEGIVTAGGCGLLSRVGWDI